MTTHNTKTPYHREPHEFMGFKVRVLPPKSKLVTQLRERDARDMCNAAKKGIVE
jgi:hypothetical protein